MKKNLLALVAVVVAAAFFWAANRSGSSISGNATASKEAQEVEKAQAAQNNRGVGESGEQASSSPAKPMSAAVVPEQLPLADFKLLDSRVIALSEREAEWLARHGYPTQDDLKNVGQKSFSELEAKVSPSNPMASVLLGLKYEEANDLDQARASYETAAQRGSLYAMQRAAEIGFEQANAAQPNHKPSYEATAYYLMQIELANYLGDHRSERQALAFLPAGTSLGDYSRDVLSGFQQLLGQYNTEYKRLYGQTPQPDPRPNEEQWRAIDAGDQPIVSFVLRVGH